MGIIIAEKVYYVEELEQEETGSSASAAGILGKSIQSFLADQKQEINMERERRSRFLQGRKKIVCMAKSGRDCIKTICSGFLSLRFRIKKGVK